MEKIINIEINDLKYLYSQLSLAIDCLHTDIKNLEEELEILLQYWKGEAQKIFINNLKNDIDELKELAKSYSNYCGLVKFSIAEYISDNDEAIRIINKI
ncbi:hypothetical protein [uncultured Ruminococcus sp.]|uniref:hypothetical protein n=1 Tax=uncultured Ruminococcus sp. TaxID=165186 RepID=UPI0025EEAFDB|nr:hypothetical protein [uncultured Ruminococcus sp.]